MALLGGAHRLWGPLLGAIPLVLLFEFLATRFPSCVDIDHGRGLSPDRVRSAARRCRPVGQCRAASSPAAGAAGGEGMMSATSPVLEVTALARAFGGLVAVNAIDLNVQAGEIVGLLGPNGSGKTTVLNLVSGVLRPDAGTIRFAGQDIAGMPTHRIARLGLARTFQLVRVLDGMDCARQRQGRARLSSYAACPQRDGSSGAPVAGARRA